VIKVQNFSGGAATVTSSDGTVFRLPAGAELVDLDRPSFLEGGYVQGSSGTVSITGLSGGNNAVVLIGSNGVVQQDRESWVTGFQDAVYIGIPVVAFVVAVSMLRKWFSARRLMSGDFSE